MERLDFDIRSNFSKDEYAKIMEVAKRAKALVAYGDVLSIAMDIEASIKAYAIDIDKLSGFDDFNLCHDIGGIQKRIDRQNYFFVDDCFTPRSQAQKA